MKQTLLQSSADMLQASPTMSKDGSLTLTVLKGDDSLSAAQRYCVQSIAQTLSDTLGGAGLTIRRPEQWEPA